MSRGRSRATAQPPPEGEEVGGIHYGAPSTSSVVICRPRAGLDARQRLKVDPRGLTAVYFTGEKAPCPCIADGNHDRHRRVPGKARFKSHRKSAGGLAVAVIRNRKTGEGVRYTIKDEWLPQILGWNKTYEPAGRYDAAMKAVDLFQVEPDAR
jgi:hypothetical protein